MPLRDHFHPPVSRRSSWEGFHGLRPGIIVQQLAPQLPDRFVAEPRVHLGDFYEIDVCTYKDELEDHDTGLGFVREQGSSLATAPQTPPLPTLTLDAEFAEQYAYEVLIFDVRATGGWSRPSRL